LVRYRKLFAVELPVVNSGLGPGIEVNPDRFGVKHCRQMVRDEAVAATNVKEARFVRKHARDFERHVVSAADLATASFTSPPALDSLHPQVCLRRLQRTALADGFRRVVR
jgi:hypothetical protein